MRWRAAGAHTACMETTYLTYLAQAQSGSLAGPPIELPRFRRRRKRVRVTMPAPASALL